MTTNLREKREGRGAHVEVISFIVASPGPRKNAVMPSRFEVTLVLGMRSQMTGTDDDGI
jgi:hypothetical protein